MQPCVAVPATAAVRSAVQSTASRGKSLAFRRGIRDISITRTGRPIIRIQGGRWV